MPGLCGKNYHCESNRPVHGAAQLLVPVYIFLFDWRKFIKRRIDAKHAKESFRTFPLWEGVFLELALVMKIFFI